jgi:proteasome lid subunit RPN8/RPN11
MGPRSLSLTAVQKNTIIDWVQVHIPEEACGLLGGRGKVVQLILPVPNHSHSPTEFNMDGQAQLEAMQTIEAEGLEITAIFHSHPKGPQTPSLRDIRSYYYPDSVMLIIAPVQPGWDLFAFRIENGRAFQIPINYLPGVTPPV